MASLPIWVQYARRPSMTLTWYREGTTVAEDLTGATISGSIRNGEGTVRAITGALTVTSGTGGQFRWDLSAADVGDAGRLMVQFTATFGSGQTPAKTFKAAWDVTEALA